MLAIIAGGITCGGYCGDPLEQTDVHCTTSGTILNNSHELPKRFLDPTKVHPKLLQYFLHFVAGFPRFLIHIFPNFDQDHLNPAT